MKTRFPIRRIAFLLLGAMLMAAPAPAQDRDTALGMVVHDVPVDETAQSAVQARQAALQGGQRRAFETVLRRITLREHWPSLPKANDDQIADVVEALEIADEKTSPVRYLARLTVRFKAQRIRRLLESHDIPYTETVSKPVLVLPVMESAGALMLFDEANNWRAAWSAMRLPRDSLLPIALPLGDLKDETQMTAEIALSGERAPLQEMAQRYGADSVVVMHAIAAPDLKAGGRLKVDVFRNWLGGAAGGMVVTSYSQAEGEDEAAFLRRVAGNEREELVETWKRRTLLFSGEEQALSVQVPIDDLSDWLTVRDRLSRIGMVRRLSLRSISRSAAQLDVYYIGDAERLEVSLAQQDMSLEDKDGFWILRARPTAADAPTLQGRQ
jgi:hypothetical protein